VDAETIPVTVTSPKLPELIENIVIG